MNKTDKTEPTNSKERRYIIVFCVAAAVYLAVCAVLYISACADEREAFVNVTPIESESDDVPITEKVNINTATAEELKTLSGIGDVTAERIIEYREKYNGFLNTDELLNVKGIGSKLLEKLLPYITV